MYIEPQTNIRLLKDVPLDTSYDHTIYFSTAVAQANYFIGKQKYNLSNYTYQRVNKGVARVGIKADNLYDCNYMMFQNTAYGNRWFYAFITAVEYVNDVTANISFEIDDMQTWFFDYTVDHCFVEREHVVDDTIGAHIEPENLECGEYVFNNWDKYDPLLELAVIVAIVDVSVGDQTQSASGNLYDNIYSGASLYIFEAEDVEGLNEFVTQYVQKPDAIVSMYIAPMFLFAHAGDIDPEYLARISISEGKTCDYTIGNPINVRDANDYDLSGRVYVTAGNTYDIEIENTGSNLSFRIVGADSENIVRQVEQVVAAEGVTITHQYTAGEGVSYIRLSGSDTLSNATYTLFRPEGEYEFDIPPDHRLPDVPVGARDYFRGGAITTQATLDGYKPKNNKLYTYPYNFFHMNNGSGSELQLRYEFFRELDPIIEITGTVTQPVVVTARPVAYKNVGDDDNEFIGNRMLSTETLTLDKFPLCSWNTDAYKAWVAQNAIPLALNSVANVGMGVVGSFLSGNPLSAASSIVSTISNVIGQGYQASIKADILGGNYGNCNANIPYGMMTFFYGRCSVSAQYARIIDDFFNMFGYAVKRCKVPNRNARPHWNYVKTIGCTLTGSVPADSMRHLCQIYDHGITFWNNGDEIGNYSLNNAML